MVFPLQNVPFSTALACKEGFFGVQGSSSMSTHHALQHSAAAKAQLLRQHLQRAVDHAQMVAKAQGAFRAMGVGMRGLRFSAWGVGWRDKSQAAGPFLKSTPRKIYMRCIWVPGEQWQGLTHACHRHTKHDRCGEAAACGCAVMCWPVAEVVGGCCSRNQHIIIAAARAMLQTAHWAAAR